MKPRLERQSVPRTPLITAGLSLALAIKSVLTDWKGCDAKRGCDALRHDAARNDAVRHSERTFSCPSQLHIPAISDCEADTIEEQIQQIECEQTAVGAAQQCGDGMQSGLAEIHLLFWNTSDVLCDSSRQAECGCLQSYRTSELTLYSQADHNSK